VADRSTLERFITLEQAAQQLRLDQTGLARLIDEGYLRAALLPDDSIGVSLTSVQALLPREDLPDYQDFAHLKGQPISISEAARKYGIHTSTLTRWMQRGYITRIGKDGRRTLLPLGLFPPLQSEFDIAHHVGQIPNAVDDEVGASPV